MSARIGWIDAARGACMLVVVVFHVVGYLGMQNVVTDVLLGVALCAFFMISGLFFHESDDWMTFFKRKARRLLVPFLLLYYGISVVMANGAHYLLGVQINTVYGWPSLWAFVWPESFPNIPIWFLWSLFLVTMLYDGVCRLTKDRPLTRFAACCTAGLVAWWMIVHDIDLPAFLDDSLLYLPMFWCGHQLQQKAESWHCPWQLPVLSFIGRHTMAILATHVLIIQAIGFLFRRLI